MCLIEGLDYIVREVPFPNNAADGVTVSHPDGIPNIYINSNVCPKRKKEALKHELEHLMKGDLFSEESAECIESRMIY